MNFWILFVVVEENTVSPASFRAAALLSFVYFFTSLQPPPCSFELMYLAFLLVMKLLDSSFGHFLEMIHKLLDEIPTFTIPHKEEVKQASHMLTGKSYSCCSHLLGLLSVCEPDVMTNISVDALIVNELVSHFWDLETAQWYCRCLHGIVDVACVASLCFYLLCVVCICCG